MFDQFTDLVAQASGWGDAIVVLFAVIDAILPLVPSESAVITAGVVAAAGDVSLPLIIVAAAIGAFTGDNLAYAIGRRYGSSAVDRFFRGDKAHRRLDAARRQLDQRGGELIAVGRFIPGGHTAVTFTAGLTGFRWPRFAAFDAIAALIWAGYAGLLGYFGGHLRTTGLERAAAGPRHRLRRHTRHRAIRVFVRRRNAHRRPRTRNGVQPAAEPASHRQGSTGPSPY